MTLNLEELIAREEIRETLSAYAQGLDQRNWEIYDSAWAEGATFIAPDEGIVDPISANELKQLLISNNDATRLSGQHLLNNTWFEFVKSFTKAHAVTEVTWVTLQATDKPDLLFEVRGGGLYVDDLVKTDLGWRISNRALVTKNKATRGVQYSPQRIKNIRKYSLNSWQFAN